MTELKEICKVQCGFAFDSKKFTEDDSFSPLIRIRDVKRGFTQTYYTGEFSSEYIVHKGDLLVGMDGEFNIARWNSEDALLNQRVCRIIANSNVNEEYLRFYLKRALKLIESKTSFVTVKHLSAKELNGLKLNLPCMEDQQCISKQLSILELVIRKNKKVLELFDELVKARFVEMFGNENNSKGWEIVNIEDVANVQVGVVIKPSQYYTNQYNGIKAFRSLNIGNGYIKDDDWVYFSKEGNKKNKKSILSTNDVLVVRSGAPGTACVVTNEYAGSNAIDVIIAHPDFQKVDSHYLCTYTNMPHGKSQIIEGTGGAAQQHFNVGKYNKLKLMLPPLEYQKKYVKFLEEIDKSRSRIQKSLEASQELFDSLMQEYFG